MDEKTGNKIYGNSYIGSDGLCFLQIENKPEALPDGSMFFTIQAPGAKEVRVEGLGDDKGV